ncbi:MAG: GFA family protein [Steroidobacteraceae bacterium]
MTGEPFSLSLCHCRSCRLASGAPSVAWAVFRPSEFSFLRGDPIRFHSSPPVTRIFCGECGTPLTYQSTERLDTIDVTPATFDTPDTFPPAKEIWIGQKISWENLNEGLPHFSRSSIDS